MSSFNLNNRPTGLLPLLNWCVQGILILFGRTASSSSGGGVPTSIAIGTPITGGTNSRLLAQDGVTGALSDATDLTGVGITALRVNNAPGSSVVTVGVSGNNFTSSGNSATINAVATLTLAGTSLVVPSLVIGLVEEIDFEDANSSIAASTYTLTCYAQYGFTINLLKIICTSGTCTAALKINGTSVTGISAVGVSSTIATGTASAANVVVAGDIVTLVTTSNSSLVDLKASIKTTRS